MKCLPGPLSLIVLAVGICAADSTEISWTTGLGASGLAVAIAQIGSAYWQYRTVQLQAIYDEDCAKKMDQLKTELAKASSEGNSWRQRAERAEARLNQLGDRYTP